MKFFLLFIIVLSFNLSAIAQESSGPNPSSSINNDSAQSDFDSFKASVMAGEFANTRSEHEVYTYTSCSKQDLQVLSLITLSTSNCSDSFGRAFVWPYTDHEYGNTEEKVKNELRNIMQAASNSPLHIQNMAKGKYRFVSGDYIYIIDLNYPAIANPISRTSLSGNGPEYYLSGVQTFQNPEVTASGPSATAR